MPEIEKFEYLILGSGQGGKLLAWHLAKSGKRVAVVERQWVGGSCPSVACLPSKNEIWSAKVAHLVRHSAEYGTTATSVSTDMTKVRQRKRNMVSGATDFHIGAYKGTGAELIMGVGHFVKPKTIEVRLNDGSTRLLAGDHVYLNVGTHAAIPDIPGLAAAQPLTHIGALELGYVPAHLIVLGGGYIGIEMAQAFRRFGSRVTVIEANAQIMSREDSDVADEIQRILTGEGIEFMSGVKILNVNGISGTKVGITIQTSSGEQMIEGSDILVAAGRLPNTAGIGLENAGVELDSRGYIRVNDRLESSAPGVWAIGECAGSPQFTHASVDDFRIIRDNLVGGKRSTSDRLVPYCMFTDPPLARVGLSEREAQVKGIAVRVAKLPMAAVLRTEATSETQGFMKVVVAENDDRILGFTMIGSEAGEVLAAVQTAMLAALPYPVLRDAVIAHLTIAEGLGPLFSNIPSRSVN
ncbi:FAD-dependent oxidoreductase [Undibacterium sp. TJN25]|uniref:FAD-dependent oxidoreductase n=1 Tax=Undibacterium sp. TJN25 TaxID=3413056 RepID=UPI003BF0C296